MDHSELKERTLERKNVKVAYEALETEFSLLRELLNEKSNILSPHLTNKEGNHLPFETCDLFSAVTR